MYAARLRDRATIAKRGLVGRVACCGGLRTGSCGSVSVASREIRRNGGKYGYQPMWQLMRNTPETPDPGQRTRKINAASGTQARLQVGPEAFQDTPPNRRGDPKVGACDGRSRESGHGLPKQPQGVTGVLRGLSTPGGSGVLVTSRNWPVTGARAVLQTHQRIGRVTQRGSAPTPVRGNGQHQLTAPEDVG